MNSRRACSTAFLLLLLGSAGCNDRSSPTAPASSVNLAGAWIGQISYPQSSGVEGALCASETLNTTLSQIGTGVTARIETSCGGPLSFQGSVEGNNAISGILTGAGPISGRVTGVAFASRIEMTVTRSGKGEAVQVCWIALAR